MDWGRAKTILLLSFLFLNVILGYQLWMREMKEVELAVDTEEIIEETNRMLVARNIQTPNGIPAEAPKLKEITLRLSDAYKSDVMRMLPTPIHFSQFMEKLLPREQAIRLDIPRIEEYQFDAIASKRGVYVMHQQYGSFPLFDVKLELVEEDGQIIGYKQAYAEIEQGSEQKDLKEQKVIFAHIAIRSLAENYLDSGTVITDIRLGYHGQQFDSPILYMMPYWRVATSTGETYYIHGFDGSVEAPQNEVARRNGLPEP